MTNEQIIEQQRTTLYYVITEARIQGIATNDSRALANDFIIACEDMLDRYDKEFITLNELSLFTQRALDLLSYWKNTGSHTTAESYIGPVLADLFPTERRSHFLLLLGYENKRCSLSYTELSNIYSYIWNEKDELSYNPVLACLLYDKSILTLKED